MSYVICAIGTDVGKTVISALFCQALRADYWKPVQAGDLDYSDTDKVKSLVSFPEFKTHPETHRLNEPMSPHAAAARDGISIHPHDFIRPNTQGSPLVTELAGGLMVPLSHPFLTIDLAQQIGDPVVLVVNSYLGSINHTLLSLEVIKSRGLNFAGLVFNGDTNPDSRKIIVDYSGAPVIADIPYAQTLDKGFIKRHADTLR